MDEKDFKKHLQDLAHGHHHPEEHDWEDKAPAGTARAEEKPKPERKQSKRKKRA